MIRLLLLIVCIQTAHANPPHYVGDLADKGASNRINDNDRFLYDLIQHKRVFSDARGLRLYPLFAQPACEQGTLYMDGTRDQVLMCNVNGSFVSLATAAVAGGVSDHAHESASGQGGLLNADNIFNAGTLNMAYGGTNANLTASNGAVVYSGASALALSAVGTANYLLQSNGAAAPSWTNAPTILGTNITSILAASINAGSLGSAVIASSITLAAMYGSPTLTGTNFTGLPGAQVGSGVPAANIAAGSLGTSVIASSITAASIYTGANLASTSVPDAALSANAALLNRTPQTWTGENTFNEKVTFGDGDTDRNMDIRANLGGDRVFVNFLNNSINDVWQIKNPNDTDLSFVENVGGLNLTLRSSGRMQLITGHLDIQNGSITASSATLSTPLTIANGGTSANLAATGGTNMFLKQATAGGNITVSSIAAADIQAGSLGGLVIASSVAAGAVGTAQLAATANAPTATALATNGGNCSAGQTPLGVDASGAVEGCFTPAGAGDVILATTQTFTGSNTFQNTASTLTVIQNQILLGTSTTAGVYSVKVEQNGSVTFPSSATWNTPAGASNYSISISTGLKVVSGEVNAPIGNFTYIKGDGSRITGIARSTTTAVIPHTTGTNTTFTTCNITGSTVTLTVPEQGGPVLVTMIGGMSTSVYPNAGPEITFQIDGAFPSGGYDSVKAIVYGGCAANISCNMAFTFITSSLSAGSHSFCLAARVQSAATWTFFNASDPGVPRFTVMNIAQ